MAKEYSVVARIVANVDDFVKNINNAQKKANEFSRNFSDRTKKLSDSFNNVGSQLTNKITKPVMVAGTALAGLTLGKGLQRLVGIDNARAKLVGLGHDAESVQNIMDSALESVKGTSYGLEVAATTAAGAVAAGIEPGKELSRYLSLIGDTAAIAGSGMDEIGSVMNKVTTSNKAYNSELQQLSDRGLPIYQWLADEAGTTADAIFKMASEGKISSEMLLDSVEKNIGGAAKKMGEESFTAGIANMWAAVGRLGAAFLDGGEKGKGFFSQLKPLIADFTDKIDSMGDIAEKAGVKFGEMFTEFLNKIKEVKQWYDDLDPRMQELLNKIVLFGSIGLVSLGPLLSIIGKLLGGISALSPLFSTLGTFIGALVSPVGLTVAAIGLLVGALVVAYQKSETFRDTVDSVFSQVRDIFINIFTFISDFVSEKITFIKEYWEENGEQIAQATENFLNLVQAAIEFVLPYIEKYVIQTLEGIKTALDGAFTILLGLLEIFTGLFTGDWEKVWSGAKKILEGGLKLIEGILEASFIGKLVRIGQSLDKKMNEAIGKMKDGLISKFGDVRSKAEEIFNKAKKAITDPIDEAKEKVLGIIGKIKEGFSKMKITIPKPKMPKVNVSMGTKKVLGGEIPFPKFDISWFAKGGIFDSAALVGLAEAGKEAILPIEDRNAMKPFSDQVARQILDNFGTNQPEQTSNNIELTNNFVVHTKGEINKQDLEKISKHVYKSINDGMKNFGVKPRLT